MLILHRDEYDDQEKEEKTPSRRRLMFRLLPSSTHSLHQILLRNRLSTREISCSNLGVDFYPRIGRDQVVGNVVSFQNGDSRGDDRIVFPEQGRLGSKRVRERGTRTCHSWKSCCQSSGSPTSVVHQASEPGIAYPLHLQ